MLNAFYDLGSSPPTYDIVSFLLHIEGLRLKAEEDAIAIRFLPGPRGGFRDDTLWPHTVDEREAMLRNVAVPMCWLLPSVRWVGRMISRGALCGVGVNTALYGGARIVASCREGRRPLRARYSEGPRRGRVSITLRECRHWPERNSRVQEWAAAARELEAAGWDCWVVRDASHADEPLDGLRICPKASTDLFIRARLYAESVCNMGVSNGPMWLALAMDAPLLMLRPANETLRGGPFGAGELAGYGISASGQIPGCGPEQRLAWCEDTAADILREFSADVPDNIPEELRP